LDLRGILDSFVSGKRDGRMSDISSHAVCLLKTLLMNTLYLETNTVAVSTLSASL